MVCSCLRLGFTTTVMPHTNSTVELALQSNELPLIFGGWILAALEKGSQVVSFSNPKGTITNSDLELAGTLAQNDVPAAI